MSAIPTAIPQPWRGQGQVLEGVEVCGSQLHGGDEAPTHLS